MRELKLAAGSSRAYAKPRMLTRLKRKKTVSFVLLLVLAAMLLFALAPASTTTVIPDSQLVNGNVTTVGLDEIQAGNTTIDAEQIKSDLNTATAYSSDGLTGTEIKQKIQDFVAASEEPVTADDIVRFVNGDETDAGESAFSPRPKQAAFNGICDFYVNQSGWWPGGGSFNLSNTQIQHAIDNATAGDTICVYNGSYIEDVNVDKTLTLAGEGAAVVTVTAKSTDDHVFNVTVDLVNISGFNVTGATGTGKAGICLNRSQHCNITNNTAAGNYYGIRLDYSSSNNTLTSNTANANSNGILLYYSSNNNTLVNNTANSNNYNGIELYYSSNNNTLVNNTANSNSRGILLSTSSNNNTLVNNTATLNNEAGIYLSSSSNNNITDNTASQTDMGYGIYMSNANNNKLTNNNASYNNGGSLSYGIYLTSSSDNTFFNNTANSNPCSGIWLNSSSNNNTFINNTASSNNYTDFYSTSDSRNNTVEDLFISSYPTTVSFIYGNGVGLKGVKTAPDDQAGRVNISKYVDATNVSADSWLYLNVSYNESDVPAEVEEASLRMWRNNGSWYEVAGSGVNEVENYVYANITGFSVFAPLGDAQGQPINCTCGDICVNTTGWWRNNGTFNASGTRIQDAIGNASAGNTVYVYNGSYTEDVNVNKRLTLRGEGADVVNVTNSTADSHVFNVTVNYVNISGFNVTGVAAGTYKAGIYLGSNVEHCNISDNTASNNGFGIYLNSSSNNSLSNNTANSNYYYGIYLNSSSNYNTLTSNTAYNNSFGICLSYSSNNTLTSNTAYNNSEGFHLVYASNDNITNTTAYDNSDYGIWLYSSSNNDITNTTAYNNTDYDFYSDETSHNNTVEDLRLSSYPTTVSFTYDNGVGLKGVDTAPGNQPAGKLNISKYVNASAVSASSWLYLNVSYEDSDVPAEVDEASLRMWRYNGSDWAPVSGTNGVNTVENYVYANITEFSVFAPLGDTDTTAPGINFTAPTPPNGTTTANTSVEINVSLTNADDLAEFNWNWNGANYTFYNDYLVLMMNFDNVSALGEHYTTAEGYTIRDLSEYGNKGTAYANDTAINGPVWNSTGRYGGALVFDGSDDYVEINGSDSLNITKNMTLAVWVNPASYPAGIENGRIVSKGASYELAVSNTTGEVAFALRAGGTWEWKYTDDVVPLNEWTYIVLTYDSSTGNVTIYKNGTEVHSVSESGDIWPDNKVLTIGCYSTPMGYFNGTIDEVRIWNRTLSAEELKQQYFANLRKYDTDKWQFFTNQSNLANGDYTYQAFASDTAGNGNATEKRTVTVNATTTETYIPPDPTGLQNKTGNYWVNYTWTAGTGGNVTDSFNVSMNGSWTNGSALTHKNVSVGPSGWANITVWAFNVSGTGTLSAGSVSDNVQAPAAPAGTYIPPDPTGLQNKTGNYWVNHTWTAGTGGNVTDSFNVSMNGSWTNGSALTHKNVSVGPSGWANITVWAFNVSGTGTLSAGSVSDNVQVPVDTTAPGINFTAPTPPNGTTTTNTSVEINVSLTNADDLAEFNWNWNGANYTFYNDYLVLMMNFDNVSALGEHYTTAEGYTIRDLSEYGNKGTAYANDTAINGPVWNSTGRYGGALVFDGSDDYVEINGSDSLNITKNMTLAVWVNPASYPAGIENGRIVSKGASYELAVSNTTGEVAFALRAGGTWEWKYTDDVVPLNEWTYIVLTYDSSTGNVTIYKNGTEVHSVSESGDIWPDNKVLTIGCYSTPMGYFNGTIDEVRIWNRTLSAEELKQQYFANLRKYDTDKWQFFTNQSNLANGDYTYQAFASDTAGNGNATEKRTVTVNATTTETYIPPDPTGLQNKTGNYWVNYTWAAGAGGNVTDSFNVSMNGSWTNGSALTHKNVSVGPSGWANITVWAFNVSGTGTLSAGSVSDNVQAPAAPAGTYIPPDPTGLQNKTGNYWVNYTWAAGAGGNVTDSFNVSMNGSWTNGSALTHKNVSVGPSGWANITVWAFNVSGTGTLSAGSVSDNVQAPAAPAGTYIPPDPTGLQNKTGNYWVNHTWTAGTGGNVTDLFNVSMNGSWTNGSALTHKNVSVGPSGWANITVWAFNVSGTGTLSAGSVSDEVQAPAAPAGTYIPPDPTGLQNKTGNYWVNHTWTAGTGGNVTDSFNVSMNGSWTNGSALTHKNVSVGPSGWANITVWAFNVSGTGTLSAGSVSDEVQAPAAPAGTYIPPDPTGLQNKTGNYWVNYTWAANTTAGNNVTDAYNVSNGTSWVYNGTNTWFNESVGPSGWLNITVWAFNVSGGGTLSVGSISDEVQAPAAPVGTYIPPAPINMANETGSYWVNYTWAANTTAGNNVTDAYNVSNGTSWVYNGTNTWFNETVGPSGWLNISVWAFNVSGGGTLSVGSISDEVQAPAAPVGGAPNITSFAPESPVNDTYGTRRKFNVTVNQTVNVTWYLNETFLFKNESVTAAEYTLHAEYIGENNVTAVAENANGADMQTWIWNVTAATIALEVNKTVLDPKTGNWEKVILANVSDELQFRIWVHNNGTENLTNITVNDTLSAGLEYVTGSATVNGVSCECGLCVWANSLVWYYDAGNSCTEPFKNLSCGQNITIEFNVTKLSGGKDLNCVNVSGGFNETGPDVQVVDEDCAVVRGQRDDVAIYRKSNRKWYVDTTGDYMIDLNLVLDKSGDIPLVGDINRDGREDVAIYKNSNRKWYVDTDGDHMVDFKFVLNKSGDIPLVGDFNQDGKDDVAIYRNSNRKWYVDTNGDHMIDLKFVLNKSGDIPLVGDFNQDGIEDVAIYRKSNRKWYVDTTGDYMIDLKFVLNKSGDIPLVGDINRDGRDDVVIYRKSNRKWYVDTTGDYMIDLKFVLDKSGDIPLVGAIHEFAIEVNKTVLDPKTGYWVDGIKAEVNDDVRFKIWVHNSGTCNVTNISVNDTLSAGLEYAEGSATPFEPNTTVSNADGTTTLYWDISSPLDYCQNITIEFNATKNQTGDDTNCVNVSAWYNETGSHVQVVDEDCAGVYGFLDDVAMYRKSNRKWFVDTTGDHMIELKFVLNKSGDIPLVGDINRDGRDDVAIYRKSNRKWFVDTTGDHMIDLKFVLNKSGDIPLVGDINQDGIDDVAIYRKSNRKWYVDTNGDHMIELKFVLNKSGDIPLVGDINRDGQDDVAIYRNSNRKWYVDTTGDYMIDLKFVLNKSGDIPLVGDINRDGQDDVAIYRNSNSKWFVDTTGDYMIDLKFVLDKSGDIPLVGDIR